MRQSVGLCVTGPVLGAIGMIPILGWIMNIVGFFILLYTWIMDLINAINEKEKPNPFLEENVRRGLRVSELHALEKGFLLNAIKLLTIHPPIPSIQFYVLKSRLVSTLSSNC